MSEADEGEKRAVPPQSPKQRHYPVYGNFIKASDGALANEATRAQIERQLRSNFEDTQKVLGRPLSGFTLLPQPHREQRPTSEKDMRAWGWSEDEIREALERQAAQTCSVYYDYYAWRAEDRGEYSNIDTPSAPSMDSDVSDNENDA